MKHIDVVLMRDVPQPPQPITVKIPRSVHPELIYDEQDEAEVLAWIAEIQRVAGHRAVEAAGIEPQARSFKGKIPAGRCAYCLEMSTNLQRDHIVPVSQGGTDDPDNIVAACPSCNRKKKDSSLLQFVARGGVA